MEITPRERYGALTMHTLMARPGVQQPPPQSQLSPRGEGRDRGGGPEGLQDMGREVRECQPWRRGTDEWGCRAGGDKSSEPRLNLSGSWQQGHSAAYNTPFLIQVVCKGFIARGQEIAVAHGSCDTAARGFPRAVDRLPSGMDSNLEAFSYNPAHGSVPASPYRAAGLPMVRIGGSSRTEPNYR